MQKLFDAALSCGFTRAAPLDPTSLVFMPEVRQMCEANRCGLYGKRWACPPACGDLDMLKARAHAYPVGILLQTTGTLEDSFDYEGMQEISRLHKESVRAYAPVLREVYSRVWIMPAGGCDLCAECTYPDAPCRHPDLAAPSMEACGLMVSTVCEACGVPYTYGQNTLTYVSCALLDMPKEPPVR